MLSEKALWNKYLVVYDPADIWQPRWNDSIILHK